MNFALGLFVLSLLGAEGPAESEPRDQVERKVTAIGFGAQKRSSCDGPAITYDVRVLKIDGLEWRGAFFGQLQPIASQLGGTVWTASRETAERLAELDPHGLKAPRITAASQDLAHLSVDRGSRKVASGLARFADGPFDHATQVAYTPQYEEVRDGMALSMTGRKLDQGVLACVVLDECRVAAVHHVALSEKVSAKTCCATDPPATNGKIASRMEVPEFVRASLAGEWLIPNDGVLVVSLGVQTSADPAGRAVVAERLVLIETAAADSVAPASVVQPLPDDLATRMAPAAVGIPMPMPVMPSRSLPQALDADGLALPLPPLPEDGPAPSSLPGSSEPCASPQGSNRKLPEPTTLDTGSTRAGFTPAPKGKPAEAETSDPSRPYLFRFPVNAGGVNMEVEIRVAAPSR